jgi:hypothetical protein
MPAEDRPPHKLYEAIQIVLSTRPGKEATSREINDEIDRRNLYRQQRGGKASPSQISARANNHPELFKRTQDGTIRLIGGVKLLSGRK